LSIVSLMALRHGIWIFPAVFHGFEAKASDRSWLAVIGGGRIVTTCRAARDCCLQERERFENQSPDFAFRSDSRSSAVVRITGMAFGGSARQIALGDVVRKPWTRWSGGSRAADELRSMVSS
jgi:hypothetical protein